MNGTLVQLGEAGVLLAGPSGVGKSETALRLIERGHCLIADDAPEFFLDNRDRVCGRPVAGATGLLEVRGLGVVDVRALYGTAAVSATAALELIVDLQTDVDWSQLERLPLQTGVRMVLGREIPALILPAGTGRDLALLVETALKLQQLRARGVDVGAESLQRLAGGMA